MVLVQKLTTCDHVAKTDEHELLPAFSTFRHICAAHNEQDFLFTSLLAIFLVDPFEPLCARDGKAAIQVMTGA